jgi:dolichol kinase
MKAPQLTNHGSEGLLSLVVVVLLLYSLFNPSNRSIAALLLVGSTYLTVSITGHAAHWRSRSGSLAPALCLLTFCWVTAGLTTWLAVLQ